MCALKSSRPRNAFPCGQQELYTIGENGWASYLEHLARFSAKKSTYTAQKAADALAALRAAEAMPDDASRESVHVLLRIQLVELASTCLIAWGDLDSYIMDGFPESEQEGRRNAAGHGYYARALGDDWEGVKGLMTSGTAFIAAQDAALQTGGMLPTFPGEFAAARTAFLDKYLEFTQAEELSKNLTDAKTEANNAAYRELMRMFKDGQKIFRFEAAIREQFVFDRVWEMIDGGGSTPPAPAQTMNLKGTVTHAVTGAPLFNVEVTIIRSSETIKVVTDAGGSYAANGIQLTATESVQVIFNHAGLEDRTETTDLIPGQDKVLNVVMTPGTVFFGRVTDNFGNSLAGATVRLSNADMMLEVQTDSNGNYRLPLPGLEQALSAMLAAEAMGMMPSSRPVTIAPGEQQEQNFSLSPMAPAPPPAP
jgi:hypothetical protein